MISCKLHRNVSWTFQVIAAAILLQTLFFKFTGAEESVYIFTKLGAEPWGRIGSGVAELIAHGAYRSLDLTRFAYERFAAGRLIIEKNVV